MDQIYENKSWTYTIASAIFRQAEFFAEVQINVGTVCSAYHVSVVQ